METQKKGGSQKRGKAGLYLTLGAVILLIILGAIYYILLGSQDAVLEQKGMEFSRQSSQEDAKDAQIRRLESQAKALQSEIDSISLTLGYVIKPQELLVSECGIMPVGKWSLNKKCQQALDEGLKHTLEDKKVVAIEVSGIVDTRPYGGNSPELKQEGLASFRAREAILYVRQSVPHIAVFEGLSQQLPNKRGFVVKAYYVVKN
ncbi:hypothetical protein [uncultured Helicobacter sp.]|uniref:hypothetical protein n=1 Tax=uncultured Helicobacter sp. TaxID=175537 RepID=UPI003752AD0A